MMTDKQLIARLLELLDEPGGIAERQEHPEQATDKRLQQMLNDEQMHELVEQMAFTKRAFKNEESLTEELPIADEWEKFATAHAEELDALDEENPRSRFALHLSTHKIAASFIGAVMASGIALAAIHIWSLAPTPSSKDRGVVTFSADKTIHSPLPERGVGGETTIIFDNVRLDTMLMEMADYYHVSVEFEREEARQLRFHFVWKRTDALDRLVEKLNNFEAVNIVREPEKLIVK